jgi:hypothetical protein
MNIGLLQAPGGIPTSQVYAQLLAMYLYQNDLYVYYNLNTTYAVKLQT